MRLTVPCQSLGLPLPCLISEPLMATGATSPFPSRAPAGTALTAPIRALGVQTQLPTQLFPPQIFASQQREHPGLTKGQSKEWEHLLICSIKSVQPAA